MTTLAEYTTLRVGGPARRFIEARTAAELVGLVSEADRKGEPVLVLAGGSNLLVADEGFDGLVIRVANTGAAVVADNGVARITAAAGEPWDFFVAKAVEAGYAGVEALSGIPGQVGATPIQNVGAYGQEVSQTIETVSVFDRRERRTRDLSAADCEFGYRDSLLKRSPGRFLVLEVTFVMRRSEQSQPIRYAELARHLGVEVGETADLPRVREVVLQLRRGKGMVVDPDDHDTWSAGSFFTNPVVAPEIAAGLPEDAPAFPTDDGRVKLSAAWLIGYAGFQRGHGSGPATLSTKHTLALTNRGGATTADILALAREIRDGVEAKSGVRLVPEPVLVGCSL